jgi:hypothetical protein
VQGHVAYPQLAANPVHALAPALAELVARSWDEGTEHFQPTSFQVSNLNSGTGAPNVIPGELKARFNLRYSPVQTLAGLKRTVEEILRRHGVRYTLEWHVSGEPFYTAPGVLSHAVAQAVAEVTGVQPKLSTSGGTSDGRFIAPLGAQVVELGVVNVRRLPPAPCRLAITPAVPSASAHNSTQAGIASPRKRQFTSLHSPLPVSTLRTTSHTGVNWSSTVSGAPQEGSEPGGRLCTYT